MNPAKGELEESVRRRFARLATDPAGEKDFAVGPRSALSLGYDPGEIGLLPAVVAESFAGVGCPFLLGDIDPGLAVVDIGCGSGVDSLLAAGRVGPRGAVLGLDMTGEMVGNARSGAESLNLAHARFIVGHADRMEIETAFADIALSNGVINLCVDKVRVLAEIARIVKPGGRLFLADIFLEAESAVEGLSEIGQWSD